MKRVIEKIKKSWNKKVKNVNYELKYEKSLSKIDDLKNEIKVLKRQLNDDYKLNLIENYKKQLIREKQINANLREENLKLIKLMRK